MSTIKEKLYCIECTNWIDHYDNEEGHCGARVPAWTKLFKSSVLKFDEIDTEKCNCFNWIYG